MAQPLLTYRGTVYPWQCDQCGEVVARTPLKAVHLDTEARKSRAFAESIVAKAASLLASA